MRKLLVLLAIVFFTGFSTNVVAQCAMCRAGATSSMNNKQPNAQKKNIGAGLNSGILYLMAVPYVLGGMGLLVWFRNKKQIKAMFSGE